MQSIGSTSAVPAPEPAAARPAPRRVEVPVMPSGKAAPVEPDPAQVRKAIEAANEALKHAGSDLEFEQDDATGKTVIRVIDSATRQVIRQFPSEEMLGIARALDRLQGLLVQQKA
jgi:flagellar protein FlaG